MADRVHYHPRLIFAVGTKVVSLREAVDREGKVLHPRGAVGVVVKAPVDLEHAYRIRFLDGYEEAIAPSDVVMLAQYKEGEIGDSQISADQEDFYSRVIYRCVVGSRAYGLDGEDSDTDHRGIFLPTAKSHWSLHGVPDQLECHETQEHYWEFQRFLVLALKANPNVLECLYTPLIESATPLAKEVLDSRSCFLSKMVYQTYSGYVMSQFKKMQSDLRNQGELKWKHVMHLIRLLLSGVTILREGIVPVKVEEHRERLLAIKRKEVPWTEVDAWRLRLHAEFDEALQTTKLPERPDYDRASQLLLKARRAALLDELP